jgi:DNA-nicking Smr family endonuclease
MDLHGVLVHDAYHQTREHIAQGYQKGYKKLTVITGRSGQINQEMSRWLEGLPKVRSFSPMNGGGAWQIMLKANT